MRRFYLKYSRFCIFSGLVLLMAYSLTTCNQNTFTRYDDNYSYYLKYKSPYTDKLPEGQMVIYQMQLESTKDSLFWDSQHFTIDGFSSFLNSEASKTNFEQVISQSFSIKDSIVLQCRASALFKDFFKKPLPHFLKPETIIKATLWIDTVIHSNAIATYKAKRLTACNQVSESQAIAHYLKVHPHQFFKNANLYMAVIKNGTGESIKKGETVSVRYKGYFLDGTTFDNTGTTAIDFEYGEQSQLLPGLMKAIGRSHYEDSFSVLLPSVLAYGENGSSDGFIKPYTPLVYHVSVRRLK